jgi:type I restriction enzyme, S subunit
MKSNNNSGRKLVNLGFRYMNIEIPNEWNLKSMDECCNILDSKRVPLNFKERDVIMGDIPYYGANGVQGFINKHIFDDELILLAEDGGYFDEFQHRPIAYRISGKSWVNNHAHVLQNKEGYDLNYIFYSLVHKNIIPWINGTTRTKLNQTALKTIKIPVPSNDKEQEKIGSILANVNDLIQKQKQIVEHVEKLRKGLKQKLFLEGIKNEKLEKSKLPDNTKKIGYRATFDSWLKKYPKVPSSWKIKTLEDICEKIVGGGTPSMKDKSYFEGKIPWITVKDVSDVFVSTSKLSITEKAIEESSTNKIPANNIIIVTRMGLGLVFINSKEITINQDLKGLVLKEGIDPFFVLEYLLKESNFFKAVGQGSTVKGIEQSFIKNFPIPVPLPSEQKRISDILKGMFDLKLIHLNQKLSLEQLKKGIMQQLLTGQKRVKV